MNNSVFENKNNTTNYAGRGLLMIVMKTIRG